ncbi:Glucose-6-phosphate 1-dehydrogenase [Kappamyces sp. JEL0680]|nr:Glucose-6-phosphate 1-dehydrogenase [Kappamyces sp. JEL0680]
MAPASTHCTIIGASGDLAFKKTYPALFGLFRNRFLPANTHVVGYARSKLQLEEFKKKISSKIKLHNDKDKELLGEFLDLCTYEAGAYDEGASYSRLAEAIGKIEAGSPHADRVFYMALPPSVFGIASEGLRKHVYSTSGSNRLIVEKPFGKDTESSHALGIEIAKNWKECEVMQNHLLQILTIVAMEKPVTLDSEDVRNEKVKVLRAIPPLKLEQVLIGQYSGSADGKEPGYLDDPTVPKALNEQKCEIRIQFNDPAGNIYKDTVRNELVIRVQPQEAVYMKFMNKQPGLSGSPIISELDLSYNKRYTEVKIPDAYESLILDCLRGDKSNFVRDDELDAAWKIFTPLLHELEEKKIRPEPYTFGTRGPARLNEFVHQQGYARQDNYIWTPVNGQAPKL